MEFIRLFSLPWCVFVFTTRLGRVKNLNPGNPKKHNLVAIAILQQLRLFAKKAAVDFQIDPPKVIHTKSKTLAQWIKELTIEDEPHITLIDNLQLQRDAWAAFRDSSGYVLLDLYFYGIIIHRPQQTAETFFMRVF